MKLVYLASAYTTPENTEGQSLTEQLEFRLGLVCQTLARIRNTPELNQGKVIFSPIAMWHHTAKNHDMPKDNRHWWEENKKWLDMTHELWIDTNGDWKKSSGVNRELGYMQGLNKPVFLLEWGIPPLMSNEVLLRNSRGELKELFLREFE